MTDKLENYQENNQTAYKGTASDDSITITDIDFSGTLFIRSKEMILLY